MSWVLTHKVVGIGVVEESAALDLKLRVLLVIETAVAAQPELEEVAHDLEVLDQVGFWQMP